MHDADMCPNSVPSARTLIKNAAVTLVYVQGTQARTVTGQILVLCERPAARRARNRQAECRHRCLQALGADWKVPCVKGLIWNTAKKDHGGAVTIAAAVVKRENAGRDARVGLLSCG
jgi:hypothetical protein